MYNIKKLLFIFALIQLLQCCFPQSTSDFFPSIVAIRNRRVFTGRLMIGSLIKPNEVITSRRWVIGDSEPDLIVEINCHKLLYNRNSTDCLSSKVKEVILYENRNSSNKQDKIEDPLSILVLENPLESVYANPTRIATLNDTINENNCFFARYEYGQLLMDPGEGQYSEINKAYYRVSGFDTSFNTSTFIFRSRFDVTNVITESSFDDLDNPNEKTFHDFITRQDNRMAFNYNDGQNFVDMADYSLEYSGIPLFCTIEGNQQQYVQVGLISSGTWASVYNIYNQRKMVLLLYYTEVVDLNDDDTSDLS